MISDEDHIEIRQSHYLYIYATISQNFLFLKTPEPTLFQLIFQVWMPIISLKWY